jgi:hypothetical protein
MFNKEFSAIGFGTESLLNHIVLIFLFLSILYSIGYKKFSGAVIRAL